jgi:hypothetical protein
MPSGVATRSPARWAIGVAAGALLMAGVAGCTTSDRDEVRTLARHYASAIVRTAPTDVCGDSSLTLREKLTNRTGLADDGAKDTACEAAWEAKFKSEGRKLNHTWAGFYIEGVDFPGPDRAVVHAVNSAEEEWDMVVVREAAGWRVAEDAAPE